MDEINDLAAKAAQFLVIFVVYYHHHHVNRSRTGKHSTLSSDPYRQAIRRSFRLVGPRISFRPQGSIIRFTETFFP